MSQINVTRSSMPSYEEYCEQIKELWDSRWLTNNGAKHQQLERKLENYFNAENVTLFVNGHLALEIALQALKLEGEVITTPFTFASTTQAIVRSGLTPVFCDINDVDYTIDVNKIEELITDKTCAILPVHVYGNMCDTEKISEIAKKYNLKAIYDAAHAFGVTKNNISAACFGDISMFSFHATKVFNTIEGGALSYKDKALKEKLCVLKNFGQCGEDVTEVAINAKMNEFAAAMGLCNLNYIEKEIEKRKRVAEHYRKLLSNVEGIKLCPLQEGVKSNYSYFPVVFDGFKYTRDQVIEKLKKENIFARKYFFPCTNEFSAYKNMFEIKETPVAKYISERILTLPLYADLELSDVERICDIILK
ncbi:MAG: DegT/DnrJ/EryC1/StrS family aminotransferase [Ruminococcaceae bacterium]|nr:DegT/DnrJ/EryC1/StrS family aminotransferase [Oscillospiraceae bacterium]